MMAAAAQIYLNSESTAPTPCISHPSLNIPR
jgi:hypothetical protein